MKSKVPNLRASSLLCLLAAAALAAGAGTAGAQQNNPFNKLSGDSDQPIQVDADSLEVRDKEKKAIFRGNVVVVQGEMTLRTVELWVDYEGDKTAGDKQNIRRLEAKGRVLVTTKDQETSGDWAVYEVATEKVTIGGKVVVTQGTNVINGTRLVVDLATGRTHFESPDRGGRVQAIFAPKSGSESGEASSQTSPKKP